MSSQAIDSEKSVEISDYVGSLRRRRRLIFSIWFPIVTVSLLLAIGLPSEYGSTATFQLKTDLNDQTRSDTYADRYITGLTTNVLASPDLRAALPQLQPYPDLADDPTAELKKFQTDVKAVMLTQKILDPQTGMERNINTGFTVTYNNRDPETAQRVATWLGNAYIMDSRRTGAAQALNESKFYAGEADREQDKITQGEAALAKFKQENYDRLPETTQTNLAVRNMTDQDLASVERELRAQQQNRTFIQQQLQQARTQGGNTDSLRQLEDEYQKKAAVYDPNHPDMIALRQQIDAMRSGAVASGTGASVQAQLAAQRTQLAEMKQRYSEDYPDVKRLERSIANLQARAAAGGGSSERSDAGMDNQTPAVVQLTTQLNGVESQISALEAQRSELRQKQASLQSALQSTPEVERTYDSLNRELTSARATYQQLITKKSDADIRAAGIKNGTADQFSLVAPPGLPKGPSKPPRLGIALIGIIGASFLALMAALAAISLDSTVRGTRDVVSLLNVAPIAIVPHIQNAAFLQRQRRRLTALAATTLIAIPALYLLIRFAVP
jgi:polysaccharide biosynthesis transport protein